MASRKAVSGIALFGIAVSDPASKGPSDLWARAASPTGSDKDSAGLSTTLVLIGYRNRSAIFVPPDKQQANDVSGSMVATSEGMTSTDLRLLSHPLHYTERDNLPLIV